jgi:hypothetical protein
MPGCRVHEQKQDAREDQRDRGPRETALPRNTPAVSPMVPGSVREA